MSKSQIFITSDLHFDHTNIIRFCNRPFKDVEEMNKALIDEWNSKVTADDICYHLGDFSFGSPKRVLNVLSQLNGEIKLISGNHDEKQFKEIFIDYTNFDYINSYLKNRKVDINERSVIFDPFKKRCISLIRDIYEFNYKGFNVVLSHYPIEEWHWQTQSVHLHGHCHGKLSNKKILRFDVGWDTCQKILTLDEAITLAQAK